MEKGKVYELIGVFRFRIPQFLPGDRIRLIDSRHNGGSLNLVGYTRAWLVLGSVYEVVDTAHNVQGWWVVSVKEAPNFWFSANDFEMVYGDDE